MSFLSILARTRIIHRISLPKITLIPLSNFSAPNPSAPPAPPTDLSSDEGSCILAAFNQFTIDKPRRLTTQASGSNSVWQYDLPTIIPGWNDTFKIERIQYPLVTSPPNLEGEFWIDSRFWRETLDTATGRFTLIFTRNRPIATFGIYYICPHIFDPLTNTSTIPAQDEEAVCQLAASFMFDLAANLSAGFADKTSFEGKDLGNQSDRYERRAEACKKKYEELMTKRLPEFSPTWVNWDNESPGGWERPFHPIEWY